MVGPVPAGPRPAQAVAAPHRGGLIAYAAALALPLPPVVAAAIAVQVLANPLATAVDRVALPAVAEERAELREAAAALPRRAPPAEGVDFVKLTRRALSSYGDLAKLVASPLTELPVISERGHGWWPQTCPRRVAR